MSPKAITVSVSMAKRRYVFFSKTVNELFLKASMGTDITCISLNKKAMHAYIFLRE